MTIFTRTIIAPTLLLLFFSLLSLSLLSKSAEAKIYQWTDSSGQKHFSQTPPPKQAGKKAPKVEVRKEKFKPITGIRKTKKGSYCGKIILPRKAKDPIIELANVDYRRKHWLKDIQRQQLRLSKLYDEQREFDSNKNKSGDNRSSIKHVESNLNDIKCALSWSKNEKTRLYADREKFKEDLENIREEYAVIKNRCGTKPEIQGWTNDKEAIAWAKCESNSASIKEHNKKLRELKVMESKAHILEELSD